MARGPGRARLGGPRPLTDLSCPDLYGEGSTGETIVRIHDDVHSIAATSQVVAAGQDRRTRAAPAHGALALACASVIQGVVRDIERGELIHVVARACRHA